MLLLQTAACQSAIYSIIVQLCLYCTVILIVHAVVADTSLLVCYIQYNSVVMPIHTVILIVHAVVADTSNPACQFAVYSIIVQLFLYSYTYCACCCCRHQSASLLHIYSIIVQLCLYSYTYCDLYDLCMINTILFYRTVPLNVFNCGISFTPAGRTPACEISLRTAAVHASQKRVT